MKIEDLEVAQEAATIAAKLIRENSKDLAYLRNVTISYFFMLKPTRSKGELVKAKAKLHGELDRFIHGSDVVASIFIDAGYWKDCPDHREPLLFHNLLKLWFDDEKESFVIRPPGIIEFPEVVQRYGDWEGTFRPVRHSINGEQGTLFGGGED